MKKMLILLLTCITVPVFGMEVIGKEKQAHLNQKLIKYVKLGFEEKISQYIEFGADPNTGMALRADPYLGLLWGNVLLKAIYSGNEKAAILLLKKGANPNSQTKELLGSCFSCCSTKEHTPAIILAVERNMLSVCKLLIQCGANIDEPNENGVTALMIASKNRQQDLVILLLDAGADRLLQDNYGNNSKNYWSNKISNGNCAIQ